MTDDPSDNPQTAPFDTSYRVRTVAPGRGVAWFSDGLALFRTKPAMFTAMGVIALLVYGLVSLIPFLNFIAMELFWPHLAAGMYLAARHARDGAPMAIGDLFEPFRTKTEALLGVGGLYFAATIVLMIVMGILFAMSVDMATLERAMNSPENNPMMAMGNAMSTVLLMILVWLALMIPVAMAFLFAPLLVHQGQVRVMEALRLSFEGCLRNVLPFLVWGLIWLLAFIAMVAVAFIPVVGWLLLLVAMIVLGPVMAANLLEAYRDIYRTSDVSDVTV
ncbi:BPSS1780 family membrane protein [Marinobacteraceae bacterium S3BR75-40.1]